MRILIVGLGLIGGSFCKAIKSKTEHTVLGYDISSEVTELALNEGAIDAIADVSDFARCDMVIVCLHPYATHDFIRNNISAFRKGAVVADVCGVKGRAVYELTELAASFDVAYVSTHPMAGREFSGYEYSKGEIFENASFIITPLADTDKKAVTELKTLSAELGFGNIVEASPEEHDRIIAYTSQLAHIVSNAYIKSPTLEKECGFSAGSFQDLTRVAFLNEDMWTDLFLLNREPLLYEIDTIMKSLSEYRQAISGGDSETLRKILRDGKLKKAANTHK